MKKTQTSNLKVGLHYKFRSGLEARNAQALTDHGVRFIYERFQIPFIRKLNYTPDFLLENGIIVEIKGHFKSDDRRKHREIKRQYPDLDIRLVFARPSNRLSRKSKTTYADWADSNGFKWAEEVIPQAWMDAPMNERSRAALAELGVKI